MSLETVSTTSAQWALRGNGNRTYALRLNSHPRERARNRLNRIYVCPLGSAAVANPSG
jgi:hypothetical protein